MMQRPVLMHEPRRSGDDSATHGRPERSQCLGQHQVVGIPEHHDRRRHARKTEVARAAHGQPGRGPHNRHVWWQRREAVRRRIVDDEDRHAALLFAEAFDRRGEAGHVAIPYGDDNRDLNTVGREVGHDRTQSRVR
jgi:hypothetical protein